MKNSDLIQELFERLIQDGDLEVEIEIYGQEFDFSVRDELPGTDHQSIVIKPY